MSDGFEPFDYVRWFKSQRGGARFPLSASGVAEISSAELGPDAAPPIEASALTRTLDLWRASISARYGVPSGHAFPAVGTSGAAYLAVAALSSMIPRGAAVAVERPTYGVFEACARMCGREVVRIDRRAAHGWSLDLDAARDAFASGARIVCVQDLHNPTGASIDGAALSELRGLARRFDGWIVVDEVYRDFRPGPVGTAYVAGERVVVTSSLTKCYGLGGLRAGFLFAPPAVVERVERVEEIVHCEPPTAQLALAARALARADALLERGRAFAAAGRPVMDAWMASTPHVSWVPPVAGLSGLVRVEGLTDSVRFAERLREELDVQVVPGAFFGAEGHVRVSFGTAPEDLAASLDVLALGIPPLRAQRGRSSPD